MPHPPLSPLYARYLSPDEKKSLRRHPVDNLSSEINLLRILNSLLMQMQPAAPRDFFSQMQTLRTFVVMNDAIALLVRCHDRLHGPHSEVEELMEKAILKMSDDWSAA
jgi:aspartyl/asparaginyl beta-hydroxylase (cupin superfamily)